MAFIFVFAALFLYAQDDVVLTNGGIGGIRVCDPLSAVDSVFPAARDTVLSINEVVDGWPAKIVHLDANQWILFYGESADMIWRVTTNSPTVETLGGPRVGMTLGELQDQRISLDTVRTPMGDHELFASLYELVVHIQRSDADIEEQTAIPTGVANVRLGDRIVAISAGSGCVRVDH
ncbi:MAG: hypothetical protein PVI01_17500 [Gemmatimonadales bacterium]|jgi:hypothetical protein